jgi:predicted AAA+ superfamily ATPase
MTEKIADSLTAALPEITPRHIQGRIALPGKTTAVIGMRRAGKTSFLHQLRREQLDKGVPRERLP